MTPGGKMASGAGDSLVINGFISHEGVLCDV